MNYNKENLRKEIESMLGVEIDDIAVREVKNRIMIGVSTVIDKKRRIPVGLNYTKTEFNDLCKGNKSLKLASLVEVMNSLTEKIDNLEEKNQMDKKYFIDLRTRLYYHYLNIKVKS